MGSLQQKTIDTAEDLKRFLDSCQNGDQSSLEFFYNDCVRAINGCVRSVFRGDDRYVDDIVQDIMVYLLRDHCAYLARFKEGTYGQFKGFVLRTAYNLARNARKRIIRESARNESVENLEEQGVFLAARDIEEKVFYMECVEDAVYELPLKYREPILLKLQGYKTKEIAEILGRNQNTVLSDIAKAKSLLREKLNELVS